MVFRYPGSKRKYIKEIAKYFNLNDLNGYYEPFVGGGSVAIYVARQNKDIKLHLNDLDENIFSFWKLFELDEDQKFEELFSLLNKKPTVKLFKKLRSIDPQNVIEKAYYAIFFNRTTFSGIYRSGPIGGYEQKSEYTIDCRYNYYKLIKEINELRNLLKNRVVVSNLDVIDFLSPITNGLIYLDPPYYWEGKGLYNKFMIPEEHIRLGELLRSKSNWILSYDKCDEISDIYENFCHIKDLNCKYTVDTIKKDKREESKEYLIMPISTDISVFNESPQNLESKTKLEMPTRRSRGRPKGSKNKSKDLNSLRVRRSVGRPKGSKNKPKTNSDVCAIE